MSTKQEFRRNERGIELIELAFVLPLILLLCLGTIEFGRAYFTYNILAKAVRDGARYAATSRMIASGDWVSSENPSVETRTKNLVVYGTTTPNAGDQKIIPDLATTQINVVPQRISDWRYLTVSASYPYSPLFSLVIPSSVTMSPSVKMIFIGQLVN